MRKKCCHFGITLFSIWILNESIISWKVIVVLSAIILKLGLHRKYCTYNIECRHLVSGTELLELLYSDDIMDSWFYHGQGWCDVVMCACYVVWFDWVIDSFTHLFSHCILLTLSLYFYPSFILLILSIIIHSNNQIMPWYRYILIPTNKSTPIKSHQIDTHKSNTNTDSKPNTYSATIKMCSLHIRRPNHDARPHRIRILRISTNLTKTIKLQPHSLSPPWTPSPKPKWPSTWPSRVESGSFTQTFPWRIKLRKYLR